MRISDQIETVKEPIVFEEDGHPKLRVYEDHFEVKDVDYWEFRSFTYDEVKSVEFVDPRHYWWNQFIMATSILANLFARKGPESIRVKLIKGGDWTYRIMKLPTEELREVVREIRRRIKSKQNGNSTY